MDGSKRHVVKDDLCGPFVGKGNGVSNLFKCQRHRCLLVSVRNRPSGPRKVFNSRFSGLAKQRFCVPPRSARGIRPEYRREGFPRGCFGWLMWRGRVDSASAMHFRSRWRLPSTTRARGPKSQGLEGRCFLAASERSWPSPISRGPAGLRKDWISNFFNKS